MPGARIYEQQNAVKSGAGISLPAILRRMRMEDRFTQREEGYSDTSQLATKSSGLSNTSLKENSVEDINSILNAVYSKPPEED